MIWIKRLFTRKSGPRPEDEVSAAFMAFLQKEHNLICEGWQRWTTSYPYGREKVYARRTSDDAIEVIEPGCLSPYFNIAGYWWMPYRGEKSVN